MRLCGRVMAATNSSLLPTEERFCFLHPFESGLGGSCLIPRTQQKRPVSILGQAFQRIGSSCVLLLGKFIPSEVLSQDTVAHEIRSPDHGEATKGSLNCHPCALMVEPSWAQKLQPCQHLVGVKICLSWSRVVRDNKNELWLFKSLIFGMVCYG